MSVKRRVEDNTKERYKRFLDAVAKKATNEAGFPPFALVYMGTHNVSDGVKIIGKY